MRTLKSAEQNLLGVLFLALFFSACGGTGVGNPINSSVPTVTGTGSVSIASRGFNSTSALYFAPNFLVEVPTQNTLAPSIASFKFCVTQLRLKNAAGSALGEESGSGMVSKLGLVDLSNGAQTVTWGKATLPIGAEIKKMNVEVHKDKDTCPGADYSASINGRTISKDLEFTFNFATAKSLKDGDVVTLALTALVTKLNDAVTAEQFDDENVSKYLDGSFEDSAD